MYTPRTILLLSQQDGKSIQESNESILTFTLATTLISCSNGVSDELTHLAEDQVKQWIYASMAQTQRNLDTVRQWSHYIAQTCSCDKTSS